MLQRKTVFLFDIDGTILLTGGCGRRAFERAFDAVTGTHAVLDGFSFAGMTDRAIARTGLVAAGLEVDPLLVEKLLEVYLVALAEQLLAPTKYVILPGVRETIAALSDVPHTALGLGTGNVRRGAQAKLAYADLWTPFAFGGFGCDHEQRDQLLRAGAERGAARLGLPLAECRVVVIGDTVRDIAAARAIGAECFAVCTGGDTFDTLEKAGADAVFHDLTQGSVLPALLGY